MGVSYNKLWKLLIDRKISKSELRRMVGMAPNTLTRMNKDELVRMEVLERICDVLNADYSDIIEHIPTKQEEQ